MKKISYLMVSALLLALAFSCVSDYNLPEEDLMENVGNSPDGTDPDGTSDPGGSSDNATDDSTDDPSSAEGDTDNPPPPDPFAGLITYERDVKPILNQLCVACHNASLHEDGVDLSTYYLAKYQIDDILESMREEEDEDDIMPPTGRVDFSIIETLVYWKADGLLEGEAPPEDPDPGSSDGTYSYSADIAAIIDAHCILCHGANNPAGGYDISTYQKTVDQIDVFIQRIDLQTGQAGVMPPAGRMDEGIIQQIKAWVDQGMPE